MWKKCWAFIRNSDQLTVISSSGKSNGWLIQFVISLEMISQFIKRVPNVHGKVQSYWSAMCWCVFRAELHIDLAKEMNYICLKHRWLTEFTSSICSKYGNSLKLQAFVCCKTTLNLFISLTLPADLKNWDFNSVVESYCQDQPLLYPEICEFPKSDPQVL